MIRDFLPIGSVVMLNEGTKPVMIYGYKQYDSENQDTEYDYISVLYPEGNIGPQFQFMFNESDIKEVLFKGYETPEQVSLLDTIATAYGQ